MDDSPQRAIPRLEEYFPGSLIGGKYRLEAVVGRGGMGSVWRAFNVVLEMPVAIKLVQPEARGGESSALLLNEARLAAKLQHPSVVRPFDFGVAKTGDAYIVMELLHGSNLADLLERHRTLPATTAVRLLLPIVHGLCAAHRQGILHLDLKPENMVISKVGVRWQPKLLDFGIARSAGLRNNATTCESLAGSPAYMAPEYARGSQDIDERADVWGICVVLYELVSGRGPFTAENVPDTLRAVIESEPEPLREDDELWSILRAGLAKDRQHRLANAQQLGEALARWLIDRDQHDDVCGEPVVSNWGPAARAHGATSRLRADHVATETVVPSAPKSRWRSAFVGAAAACLGVAVAALVLMRLEAEEHARPSSQNAAVGHSVQRDLTARPSELTDPATSQAEADEAEPSAHAPVAKLSSARAQQRNAERITRRSLKTVPPARSKEAELGLRDPFE